MLRLVIIGACVAIVLGQKCSDDLSWGCTKEIYKPMNTKQSNLIWSEEVLRERCSLMNSSIGCLNEFKMNCTTKISEKTQQQINTTINMMTALCKEDSEFQQGVKKHSACLAPLETNYLDCDKNTVRRTGSPPNDAETCSALNSYLACMKDVATEKCGSEAGIHQRRNAVIGNVTPKLREICGVQLDSGATHRMQPQTALLLLTLVSAFGIHKVFSH